MAKDAKGHGSDGTGAHSTGVNQIGRPIAVSPRAINVIQKNAMIGFSVKPTGEVPTKGFQVALQGRTETKPLDLNNIAAHVTAHVNRNADVYSNPAMHIGGWNDKGKVYLEPSQNISNRSAAIRAGTQRNQVEIWDNKNMANIKTGGTGR